MPPSELTATEQQLIEYLREGMHDAEIGVRLGLPVADVKVRINQMLQRYRLLDREALLQWHEGESPEEPPPLVANERSSRLWLAAVSGALVGAGLTALAGLALWPEVQGETAVDIAVPLDVDVLATLVAGNRAGIIIIDGTVRTGVAVARAGAAGVIIDGTLRPGFTVQEFGIGFGASTTPTPTPSGPAIAPEPGHRIYGGLPIDIEFFRLTQTGSAETLTRYGPGWSGTMAGDSGIVFGAGGAIGAEGVADATGSRMAVLLEPRPGQDLNTRTLVVVNGYLEIERRFEVPRTDTLAFFTADAIVVHRVASDESWYELNLTDGVERPLIPVEAAFAEAAGWIPGIGIVWRLPDGAFIDGRGDVLFRLEHDGHVPDTVEGLVYDSFLQLDTGRTDDEAGVFGSFEVLAEGLVLIAWSADLHTLVSLVSVASGETIFTYEAQFQPVAGVRGGFAGTFCLEPIGCQAARLKIDGSVEIYPLSGPILAARSGPFARVKDGAVCAELLPEPAIIGAGGDCEPPGRLLSLHMASDDNRTWRAQIRTSEDGTQFVRVVALDGSVAWVAADAVAFAAEYLLGGN